MPGQSTDAENSKPLAKATNAGDDLTQVSSTSAQVVAQDRTNQNTQSGSGAPPVTAPLSAGK